MISLTAKRVQERSGADQPTIDERRRPGRAEKVSPHLVPLLRGLKPKEDVDPPLAYGDERAAGGDLAPARGIMVAVGASALFWAALGSVLLWVTM